MMFLAMVIALSAHQVLQRGNVLQRDQWLYDYEALVGRYVGPPALRVLLVLAGLLLLVAWVLSLVDHWLFGLVEMFLVAALFIWSLGRDDYHTALEQMAARSAPGTVAGDAAAGLWAPGLAPLDSEMDDETHDDGAAQLSALRRIAYSGFARWFAPLFYFVVAGPLLALLYRAIALLAARETEPRYEKLIAWADWVPARVLMLTFALTGDFVAVMQGRPLRHFTAMTPVPHLLYEAATGASQSAGARAIGDILYRSAGLWLVVLSAALVFG